MQCKTLRIFNGVGTKRFTSGVNEPTWHGMNWLLGAVRTVPAYAASLRDPWQALRQWWSDCSDSDDGTVRDEAAGRPVAHAL